jgi:hypothetical protein
MCCIPVIVYLSQCNRLTYVWQSRDAGHKIVPRSEHSANAKRSMSKVSKTSYETYTRNTRPFFTHIRDKQMRFGD